MSGPSPRRGDDQPEPVRLERVRAPWWLGGRSRLRRERPRSRLPVWARAGLRLPGWTLTAVAVACALAGAAALGLVFGAQAGR